MRIRTCALIAATLVWCSSLTASGEDADESNALRNLEASNGDLAVAVSAHRRGEFDRAALAYEAAIAKDPEFIEALVNLARMRAEQGRLAEAEELLDRATRLRQDYYAISKTRALVALGRKDAALAIQELTRALSLEPFDPETLANLGAALILEGRAEEASRPLRDALRIDPHRAPAIFNLALARDLANDPARAAHHYRRYLGLVGPRDPERARVEQRLAELESASVPSVSSGVDEPFDSLLPSTSEETQETNHELE